MWWRNRHGTHFRLHSRKVVKLKDALAIVDAYKLQLGCSPVKLCSPMRCQDM